MSDFRPILGERIRGRAHLCKSIQTLFGHIGFWAKAVVVASQGAQCRVCVPANRQPPQGGPRLRE